MTGNGFSGVHYQKCIIGNSRPETADLDHATSAHARRAKGIERRRAVSRGRQYPSIVNRTTPVTGAEGTFMERDLPLVVQVQIARASPFRNGYRMTREVTLWAPAGFKAASLARWNLTL